MTRQQVLDYIAGLKLVNDSEFEDVFGPGPGRGSPGGAPVPHRRNSGNDVHKGPRVDSRARRPLEGVLRRVPTS